MRRNPPLLAALALALCLSGCGEPGPATPATDAGRVPAPAWARGKPNPLVGSVSAAVVERPAPDSARIEARWEVKAGRSGCALEFLLPDAVTLIEGARRTELPAGATEGSAAWVVRFPLDRTRDAVVRLCADTPQGTRMTDATVRLVTVGR